MQIAILALGSRGDIQPYVTLGGALARSGVRVVFTTSENFRPLIEAQGIEMLALPGDAESILRSSGANMLRLVRSFRDLSAGFIERSKRIIPLLAESDLLLNQLPGGAFGGDITERYGVPMWAVASIPLVPNSAFPMVGWPTRLASIPGYNRLTYRIAEQLAWGLMGPLVNRWRSECLGLNPIPFYALNAHVQTYTSRVILGVSRHVVPRPGDWGDNVHMTGYWYPTEDTWRPSDKLRGFLEKGSPPVFAGFGSMPVGDPERTTRIVLEAVKKLDQRVILGAGWGGLGEGTSPDYALKIGYAPYSWLFPRMEALVHHGGSGTTLLGLRSGTPSVVIPFLFDQAFWGQRVTVLGAGPTPVPFRKLSPERLGRALQQALHDPEMRSQAANLGEKLRQEDGLAEALDIIEAYATGS